ncbi:antibiotic biosynthesis monooxygenase [Gemmata sp.]|uniref:antibiotic biosynthesis monooxygenase n=1 Tax=Gemmata sp. TaxID=1914242 RepID=UPI003F727A21
MTDEGPVTVVVRHRVRVGQEAAFEDWLRGVTQEALRFDGHLGFHIIRPTDPRRPEYLVLFRFDTLDHLTQWEDSAAREAWLARVAPLTTHPPARERHTGMEVWFSPPAGRAPPPRYKMVVVTVAALYPLISVVQYAVVPALGDWPLVARTLATTVLMVCVMTYAAMPLMTRVLSRWLYGRNA